MNAPRYQYRSNMSAVPPRYLLSFPKKQTEPVSLSIAIMLEPEAGIRNDFEEAMEIFLIVVCRGIPMPRVFHNKRDLLLAVGGCKTLLGRRRAKRLSETLRVSGRVLFSIFV